MNQKDKLDKQKQSGTAYFTKCDIKCKLRLRQAELVDLHTESMQHYVDCNIVQILNKADNWFERVIIR